MDTPAPGVRIRPARQSDLPALKRLQVHLGRFHRTIQPDNPRYQVADSTWDEVLANDLQSDEKRIFVAHLNGKLVGFVKLSFVDKPAGLTCEVNTLIVDDTSRRQGIGRHLMTVAEQAARERGATTIRLFIASGNNDAQSFYEQQGYELLSHRYGKRLS